MKLAEVVPLYKSKEKYLTNNYRPISLLIIISKLFEKEVYKRTYSFLQATNQLYDSQYGFLEGHSCKNAISELVGEILKNKENNKFTVSLFLDLSKAFDSLKHSTLLNKMEIYGIRGSAYAWFNSYLNQRQLRAKCRTGQETLRYHKTTILHMECLKAHVLAHYCLSFSVTTLNCTLRIYPVYNLQMTLPFMPMESHSG